MREPSPGAPTPRGSVSLSNGAVTKNIGFQQSTEQLPWASPAITLPGNCNSNLTSETPSPLVRSVSNASALTSLCADLSLSDSHFFEVLYVGKVRISSRKVPESLIDDALMKFAKHEADKRLLRRHSLLSSSGASIHSNDSTENVNDKKTDNDNDGSNKGVTLQASTTPLQPDKHWKSSETLTSKLRETEIEDEFDTFTKERAEKKAYHDTEHKNSLDPLNEDEERDAVDNEPYGGYDRELFISESGDQAPNAKPKTFAEKPKTLAIKSPLNEKVTMPENKPFLRDRSASIGNINQKTPIAQLLGEQNRTMLFQVGRSELRLISPDRKQILLHRAFKDVWVCVVGRINKEHFGFVCRESGDACACYVFKCESDQVAGEVVSAIKQAFHAHAELLKKSREKSPNLTCEHCPMLWYHRLCHDIEGMNDKKTHAFVLRRIEQLPDDEQETIITKYQGGTNHMYETSEHNAFLMILLRAHCEAKQLRHVHDTAENRTEFLNQYLGGSTIFMKAKRGFDHLLKRRASRDECVVLPVPTVKKETSPLPTQETSSEPSNQELLSAENARRERKSWSPAIVVPESESQSSVPADQEDGPEELKEDYGTANSPMMDIFLKVSDSRPSRTDSGAEPDATWRQVIYQKVVQPTESQREGELATNLLGKPTHAHGKRSREQLRQLWRLAIEQTILLVRMERENARLKEREESSAVRRIKLEYSEVGSCDAGATLMWDSLLSREPSQPLAKVDRHMLTQAVMQGVPRMSRGGVWYFLAEQAALRSPPPDTKTFPLYHTPYRTLLGGLTKHQHAILIDLGRTFPKHSYFASSLGPGQLALYNILKAYSLLDPDVGYCQGLSFVAGVLLLHMEEVEAFVLLRHLMFRRGLRKQYLPDMSALQVQLYQLSRLLRDHEPELHAKLESLDISPALYAAPWMLTLFTSQFPLGFVVRVFDLIFLEGLDVVFCVSLALLSAHRDGLLMCQSCEEAAEYLKHKLPDMAPSIYEKVMKKVHTFDLSRQLCDYAVEYGVLREEMPRVSALTEENRRLHADAEKMTQELDSAMDGITSYQKTQSRLEAQNKVLEQQLTLLSRYISAHHKQDLPIELKKIIQTHVKKTTFGSKILTKFSNDEEDVKKPFKTGLSSPNLFGKATKEDSNNSSRFESDRKHFLLKKSQSVHSGLIADLRPYPLKVVEEKSEYESGIWSRKNSGFFANTHEQIRQERLFEQQLKHDFDENLRKLDEKLTTNSSYIDDISLFQNRKSMSLNLSPIKQEKDSKLNDSGFVTPLSPDDKKDSASIISHPLSDCDVDIKFDGQSTKLKQIRPLKPTCVETK